MRRKKSQPLTELELEIMRAVWSTPESSVEEIRAALENAGRPLALPSIRTMLGILLGKGYVARRPFGRAHRYRAKVSQAEARKGILQDILQRAFEGSALSMVAALLDTRMVSKRDVDEVKQLIREHEKEKPK